MPFVASDRTTNSNSRGSRRNWIHMLRDSAAITLGLHRQNGQLASWSKMYSDSSGRGRLIAAHRAYGQGDWLEKVLASTAIHLVESAAGAGDWTAALDEYEGLHAIPLMTIHKSKGLEYHTVIFVGLDDDAWWSFSADKIEGTAGFFVAFTRAKQRVAFTYCARRGARREIAALYGLLKQAGVKIFKVD